jgi:hypothetical protein
MSEVGDIVVTVDEVDDLNRAAVARAAVARAAGFVRIAGTALVVIGAIGCVAWLWTTVRVQQAASASGNFGIPPNGALSHPGFDAVLVPWLSGPEKETVDHGSSPEVLR